MKHTKVYCTILFLVATFLISCNKSNVPAPEPYGPLPTSHQLNWQKMEYYMFIHFGPNTFTDVEWGDGKEDPRVFNPTDLDCRQWAATAKNAGMKGIIITAKHHDGFCLWPSQYSTHTVRESPWKDGKGDVLRELSDACKEYGLKFGVYLSPWDQNHPTYGTPEYNQVFANTLNEVLTNYGEIFEQWFDGATGHGSKKQVYDWDLFHKVVYDNQPQAIIFSDIGPGCRWMGNEKGVAGETNWSRLNTEGFTPGHGAPPTDTLSMGNIYGKSWVPAETDVSIRPGWFYSPSTNDKVKTLEHLVDIYHTSVGRNSNLLLNVPPGRDGRIHPNDSARLMEFKMAIDEIFKVDLIEGASITSSTVRGNSSGYQAANLQNNDYDSYWATDDNITSAALEIDLKEPKTFNTLLLQEYIPLGQRIAKFNVEVLNGNEWREIVNGTTIGYKRILRFSSVTAQRLRINIQQSLASPIMNKVGLFMAMEKPKPPTITRNREGLVTVTSAENNQTVYYTIDGKQPTTSSNQYKEPFTLVDGGTVKAIALAADQALQSDITAVIFDIAPAKWTVLSPQTGSETDLIDGNTETYLSVKNNIPVIVDLGEVRGIKGFTYIPVPDEKANNISAYNFYVSNDGKNWNKVISSSSFDNIRNSPVKQEVLLNKKVNGKFIKLESLQNVNSANEYTIAEIGLITK